jgi:hypothetical protein
MKWKNKGAIQKPSTSVEGGSHIRCLYELRGDILINELIESIFNDTKMSPSDAIGYLNDLADDVISEGKDWGEELKRCTKKYCVDEMRICPMCGSNLETKHKKSYLAEAWGVPQYETIYIDYCPTCGWNSEEEG